MLGTFGQLSFSHDLILSLWDPPSEILAADSGFVPLQPCGFNSCPIICEHNSQSFSISSCHDAEAGKKLVLILERRITKTFLCCIRGQQTQGTSGTYSKWGIENFIIRLSGSIPLKGAVFVLSVAYPGVVSLPNNSHNAEFFSGLDHKWTKSISPLGQFQIGYGVHWTIQLRKTQNTTRYYVTYIHQCITRIWVTWCGKLAHHHYDGPLPMQRVRRHCGQWVWLTNWQTDRQELTPVYGYFSCRI